MKRKERKEQRREGAKRRIPFTVEERISHLYKFISRRASLVEDIARIPEAQRSSRESNIFNAQQRRIRRFHKASSMEAQE